MFCVSENTEWEQGWCCHVTPCPSLLWHTELCQELPCPTGAAPSCLSSLARIYCCSGISKSLRPGRSIRGSPGISQHKQTAQFHTLSPGGSPASSAQTQNLFKCQTTGSWNTLSGNSDTHSGKLSKGKVPCISLSWVLNFTLKFKLYNQDICGNTLKL